MLIRPTDQEHNLFQVIDVFPLHIVDLVRTEHWLDLPWIPQEGQESWARRRIRNESIAWIDQWHNHLRSIWPEIEQCIGIQTRGYSDTAFWVDLPGFVCPLHTDGEMPGSLQLVWRGTGTGFYWYKQESSLRFQTPAKVNAGYIMVNQPDAAGVRKLLWHAMLDPVPEQDFRLTSYCWIIPK